MTPDTHAWSVYRPDALPGLPPLADNEARVVAVTATDKAVSGGWASEVALGLARGWSGSGLSVTLIDGDLVAPVLHEALGVENGTGLTDVLLFGSSLEGVSQDVEGGRFQFVTAGSPAADPELAFQQERWPQLCQQAGLTKSTLLVFVPHSAPWSKAILDRATDIIVLAATNADVDSRLRLDTRVRAMLGVSGTDPAADESADPLPVDPLETMALADVAYDEPIDVLAGSEAGAEAQPMDVVEESESGAEEQPMDVVEEVEPGDDKQPTEVVEEVEPVGEEEAQGEGTAQTEDVEEEDIQSAQDPLLGTGSEEDPLESDGPAGLYAALDLPAAEPSIAVAHAALGGTPREVSPDQVGKPSPARNIFVWGSAIVLLGAFVAVQVIRRSGAEEAIGSSNTAPVSQPATDPGPASAPQPEAVGPAARFTVTMSAYRNVAMATSRAGALAARASDHVVILVPIEVGGSVFHRLQAGVTSDSTAAAQISEELSQTLDQPSASWIIRDAPLAFELARSPSLVVATERRDQVATRAVPAYVLGVEMSDGSVEYRVYVGAYADEGESSHMRSILSENGLADIALVPRFGTAVR